MTTLRSVHPPDPSSLMQRAAEDRNREGSGGVSFLPSRSSSATRALPTFPVEGHSNSCATRSAQKSAFPTSCHPLHARSITREWRPAPDSHGGHSR
jgi:hypothetical protein